MIHERIRCLKSDDSVIEIDNFSYVCSISEFDDDPIFKDIYEIIDQDELTDKEKQILGRRILAQAVLGDPIKHFGSIYAFENALREGL